MYTKQEINEIKSQAVNLGGIYYSVFEAIDALEQAKELGLNVYINFNGRYLYSLLDDSETCQIKVCGRKVEQAQPEL